MGDLYRFASSAPPNTSNARARAKSPGIHAEAASEAEPTRDGVGALETRVEVAAKMREAALKSSIFVGVPRVRIFP